MLYCLREYVNNHELEKGLEEEMRKDITNLEEYRVNLLADPEQWMNSKAGNDYIGLPAKRLRQLTETIPPLPTVIGSGGGGGGALGLQDQFMPPRESQPPLPKKVRVAIESFTDQLP